MDKKTVEEQKDNTEKVDLKAEVALNIQLLAERVQAAKTLLELRETQLQTALAATSIEYQENGKYRVLSVDVDNRKVSRELTEVSKAVAEA